MYESLVAEMRAALMDNRGAVRAVCYDANALLRCADIIEELERELKISDGYYKAWHDEADRLRNERDRLKMLLRAAQPSGHIEVKGEFKLYPAVETKPCTAKPGGPVLFDHGD